MDPSPIIQVLPYECITCKVKVASFFFFFCPLKFCFGIEMLGSVKFLFSEDGYISVIP